MTRVEALISFGSSGKWKPVSGTFSRRPFDVTEIAASIGEELGIRFIYVDESRGSSSFVSVFVAAVVRRLPDLRDDAPLFGHFRIGAIGNCLLLLCREEALGIFVPHFVVVTAEIVRTRTILVLVSMDDERAPCGQGLRRLVPEGRNCGIFAGPVMSLVARGMFIPWHKRNVQRQVICLSGFE